jgi:hypothetical protein
LPIAPDGIFVEDVAVQGKQTEFEEPQKKTAA